MKLVVSTILALSSLSTFAATTGSLQLRGAIVPQLELSVTPSADALNVNVQAGNSGLKVATVSESCNDKNGYDITMTSANGGKLVSVNGGETTYELSYNGLSAGQPTVSPKTIKTVTNITGATTVMSDVLINVTAAPNAVAGEYLDTLTFSIVAK